MWLILAVVWLVAVVFLLATLRALSAYRDRLDDVLDVEWQERSRALRVIHGDGEERRWT